jgi:type I pantothenate kinase
MSSGSREGDAAEVTLSPEGPFLTLRRSAWRHLTSSPELPLSDPELVALVTMSDLLDRREAIEIYLPLCQLLDVEGAGATTGSPFIIGLAGSVAVGKSTTARILQALLALLPSARNVALVTTDGFLYPNSELERRGLMNRKGFPESYDVAKLVRFLAAARRGESPLGVPVYSHLRYDVVPEATQVVENPTVLIVEGLNVLQRPLAEDGSSAHPAVSDFFDVGIYLHAEDHMLERWYVERFLALRGAVFRDSASYFNEYATLTDTEARATASRIWHDINLPNLRANIAPSMGSADLILTKGADHRVDTVSVRIGSLLRSRDRGIKLRP